MHYQNLRPIRLPNSWFLSETLMETGNYILSIRIYAIFNCLHMDYGVLYFYKYLLTLEVWFKS